MRTTLVRAAAIAAIVAPLALFAPLAFADTVSVNFENPPYSLGVINGQDGWSALGSVGSGCALYDEGVSSSFGTTGFGSQSFRISDAVTSGCFGDQAFAKPLVDSVGETAATNGTFSPGTKQNHFEMQFDITATTSQPGLFVSVSPDRGDGSRMSYLGFNDTGSGIDIIFYDVQGTTNPANFVETDLGTYPYGVHTIKLSLDTLDGPSNDVVKVWVDGALTHTGTSWENYYRYDSEASAEQSPRIVKTVLFRAGGTAHPADAGKGYLIDNLSLTSGPIPPVKVTIDKLIDGKMATTGMANSNSFPMTATWSATNIGSGSGSYILGPSGFNSPTPYEAVTADMTSGASYTTSEGMSGNAVGASCADGKPYALVGYTSGGSFAAAQSAVPTSTPPALGNITSNQWILVWNKPCLSAPVNVSPADAAVLTSAAFIKADWTDVPSDGFPPITYLFESSNASSTNPDGSFTTPAYTSGTLAVSEIPTSGTPAGTWFWHARAVDADGNMSPWSTATKVIVSNMPPPPPANACNTPGVAPQGYTLRNGTTKHDTVVLAPFTMFVGMGGNDTVVAPDGNYIICTGSGNDTISIGSGNSVIDAGAGNNLVKTGDGDMRVTTGAGNDTIKTGDGNDVINAGNGNNTVNAGAGNDNITTGSGNDTIDGGAGTDTCSAGAGHNHLSNCEL